MAATELLEKLVTYAEYKVMDVDDTYFYELLDGELVQKSAPSPNHQRVLRELFLLVHAHVQEKKAGEVFFAPVDVFLNEYNAPQPDLVFVSKARESLITNDGIMGAPDLVVEIISSSSLRRGRFDKMRIFKRFALPEVWLIDPANRSVEVYTLVETEYDLFAFAAETGEVTSKALPELKVNVMGLFG
ncbi:MAG: Uma2 family endonuclease [Sphingobacteriaceae bacterium]|nr:Uma2 family endonuclease [Cytophagaceae bacterium]